MATQITRRRLGPDFTKLWWANAISNTGDGLVLAAGPLLLASLTSDPSLVAGAVFAQRLPWLLFGLLSGALVDRWDRRRVVVVVNVLRGLVVGALALAVLTHTANIPVIYVSLFLLGVGETFADNAAGTMVPAVVEADLLPRAMARIQYFQIVGNSLLAPPVGAALFVSAAALPYGIDAVSFVVAAVLTSFIRIERPAGRPERPHLKTEIAEGMRWLWAHNVVRLMALSLCLMNITLTAVMSIYVLYAEQRLGVGGAGYGVLLATFAIGGLPGALIAPKVFDRFGPAVLLRVGLVIETSVHLLLALARSPWAAGVVMALFGIHAAVFNVVVGSLRHRAVPDELRGRVASGFMLLAIGGTAVGALLGGFVARTFGITAPFWMAFGAMTILTTLAWRRFGTVRT
ncbi:MFS transporter [Lentzea sp. NBRC 105346]|uniref:MFS transporter n=1 Tax=Lentzea sp. NBRC 105346 TaxID=3032205 RepID=UPI0024A0D4B8|nr:MFS transporter [Lentzea sp. NBRC 105346]GLZ33018.1 MFS transporter [Lentzea sp. NBRC 105346]